MLLILRNLDGRYVKIILAYSGLIDSEKLQLRRIIFKKLINLESGNR